MKNWKSIKEGELIARLNSDLTKVGLPPWIANEMGRDLLAKYVRNINRPYTCKGLSFVHVSEDEVCRGYVPRECNGNLSWVDIGGPLIDHAQNAPVFRRYVESNTPCDDSPFLLWFDGCLEGEEKINEPSCFVVPGNDWMAFEESITERYPWWLSFDNDKILFAPNADSALVAFHHDCLEIAGIINDPDRVWQQLIEMKP